MYWWIIGSITLLACGYWVWHRKRVSTHLPITTLPHGLPVYSYNQGETDIIYQEIWQHKAYLGPHSGLSLQPGAIVFDVGANIGLFSLHVWEQCHGDVKIFAFEPIPDVFRILEANAKKHQGTHNGNIRVFPYGLSTQEEEVTFLHHPKLSLWSTAHPDMDQQRTQKLYEDLPALTSFILHKNAPRWLLWLPRSWVLWGANKVAHAVAETTEVRCRLRPLSAVIDEHQISQIDLLKIDVEGNELAVLQGIREHHWPLIQQIVLEVEDSHTREQIEELLTKQGFSILWEFTHIIHQSGIEAELSYVWAKRDHMS